jgi:predicted solute-binding protein
MNFINNQITEEEYKELEDILHKSMEEALSKIEVVLQKVSKNHQGFSSEEYQKIVWKVMTIYSAKRGGISLIAKQLKSSIEA